MIYISNIEKSQQEDAMKRKTIEKNDALKKIKGAIDRENERIKDIKTLLEAYKNTYNETLNLTINSRGLTLSRESEFHSLMDLFLSDF